MARVSVFNRLICPSVCLNLVLHKRAEWACWGAVQAATKRRHCSSALPIASHSLSRADLLAVSCDRALLLAATTRRMTGFKLQFPKFPLEERRVGVVPGLSQDLPDDDR